MANAHEGEAVSAHVDELLRNIDADLPRLVASIDQRLARLRSAFERSAELLAMAQGERDRLVAQCAERAA